MDARRYSILRNTRKSFLVKNAVVKNEEKEGLGGLRRDSTVTFLDNLRHNHTAAPEVLKDVSGEVKLPQMPSGGERM